VRGNDVVVFWEGKAGFEANANDGSCRVAAYTNDGGGGGIGIGQCRCCCRRPLRDETAAEADTAATATAAAASPGGSAGCGLEDGSHGSMDYWLSIMLVDWGNGNGDNVSVSGNCNRFFFFMGGVEDGAWPAGRRSQKGSAFLDAKDRRRHAVLSVVTSAGDPS